MGYRSVAKDAVIFNLIILPVIIIIGNKEGIILLYQMDNPFPAYSSVRDGIVNSRVKISKKKVKYIIFLFIFVINSFKYRYMLYTNLYELNCSFIHGGLSDTIG